MPRLVRRQPLSERIMASLNPMDFLLWLSEELETRDWDSASVGTKLGLGLNFIFLLARANSGSSSSSDDVFSDDGGSGWLAFFVYPLAWILIIFSSVNAFYTVTRTRKYRLFGANVEVKPSTPSARRVKVDPSNSPQTSSPLRYLANFITPDTPETRAHPDKASDVWELSIWDPLPASLRLFCLFGPANVLVYMIFLPLAPLDPRPSVTVFNTLVLQVVISAPLLAFCTLFAQQAKDTAIIQREVMNEYDTKFVHPRLHPVVRDIGTQFSEDQPQEFQEFVQTGTPTTQIRRTFQTHANPFVTRPAEASQERETTPTNVLKPRMFTPPAATPRRSDAFNSVMSQKSSSLRNSLPAGYTTAGTSTKNATSSGANVNFGGSMGIHSHRNSPLKKATSLNDINAQHTGSPRNSREMAAYEQRNWGQGTPSRDTDRRRLTGSNLGGTGNPFANMVSNKPKPPPERYPSRW
ncbi:Fc.00g087780.m01.CDS01 [Cosmosporella sp. VM-42]